MKKIIDTDEDIAKKTDEENKKILTDEAKKKGLDTNKRILTDEEVALNEYLKEVNKKFGAGTIGFLNDDARAHDVKVISTGSLKIDRLIGIGGVALGRITEIYGSEGSGKTTLALTTIAEAQKLNYKCLFIDVEHALNYDYAEQIGVNTDELLFSQPSSAEQAFEVMEKMILSGAVRLIVVDSVSALVPQVETEMNFGENMMAGQARFMSSSLRRLISVLSKSDCALIFINQIREKVGIMFGSNQTTSGGMALKFYASLRIEVAKKSLIKKGGTVVVGQELNCKIVKNKFAAPYRSTITSLYYGSGFDRFEEVFDIGVESGIIIQKGAWYAYGEEKIGQGKDACIAAIKDNDILKNKVLNDIISKGAGAGKLAIDEEMTKK